MADVSDNSTQSLIAWAGGPRAILAITFTDVVKSTQLANRLRDEAMREVRRAYFATSDSLIEKYGGRRIKGLGDGHMAVFRAAEDALDYTVALHASTGHPQVEVRAGIHIGPVDVEPDDVFGGEVNFASRVGSASTAAEIWISDIAMMHIQRLGGVRHAELRWQKHPGLKPKGFDEPYTLWSLSPNGPTLAEIAAANAEQVPLAVAETNIPEGMVPRHFLGREQAIEDIEKALAGGGGRVAITALHGLRGVGKTVLAAAFAERHRAAYRATWWVRAETDSGLRADLAGLAVRLGWAPADAAEPDALAAVATRLPGEGDGILLVFDNARDVETLAPFLPKGGACRVVITSNSPAWGRVATPVAIRVWPKETGADFLLARTARPASQRAAAAALSEALGGLPLAHEMAGSYCERTGSSFAEYRRRFAAAPARLMDSGADAPAEYHDRLTVAKTFALAIEEAAKLHPAVEMLISFAALLPPEPIPLFLFGEGMAELFPDDALPEAVAALRGFALVDCESIPDERDPDISTDTIRLHRLVREAAAVPFDASVRAASQTALIDAMATVYPHGVNNNPHTWPRARRLDAAALALVDSDDAIPPKAERAASYLLDRVASYRRVVLGAYAAARPLFERALAIDEKTLGPEHPETAPSLNNLALLFRELGDFAAARPLYERALAIREKTLGPEHPNTATSLNNLAGLFRAQGDLAMAQPLLERTLAIDEQHYGPDHPEVATDLNNVAVLLREQGDFAAARPLMERALAIDEKALGPDHPDTARSLNNLAMLLQDQGDLATARPLYERALAILEKMLGAEHPNTVIVRNNLASLLADDP